jgi:nucleoside-diphosphate-sugar epimerase
MTEPASAFAGNAPATVLVTGAAGFLGSRVVELLSRSARCDIVATDVVEDPALGRLPRVRFETADLRDADALARVAHDVTHVVHLAALRSKASQTGVRNGLDVNVGSTYDLLSIAARQGVRGFVYGSSHLIYGAFLEPDRPLFVEADASIRRGLSLYAAGKLASEAFIEGFSAAFGVNYLCLRFGGIYGPQAAPGSNSANMLDVLDAIDRGQEPVVRWSRDSIHSLIYVDDAARSVVRALDFPIRNAAVNVVGKPTRCQDIYSTLLRLYGAEPSELTWQEDRVRYQLVSDDRLVRDLGFKAKTTLEQGLRAIVDWHRRGARPDAGISS